MLAAGLLLGAGLATPASAVSTGWATWTELGGAAGAYTSTIQLPAVGFPAAVMTSSSRADASLAGGTATYLRATTPPGEVYGSSQGSRYVTLRPVQDSPSVPSVTTYTFASPTPQAGWAVVLGDIDADEVTVAATTPDGAAVPPETIDRWFRGAFSYTPSGTDVPTWNAATSTLTGNALAADTDGASGWFEPDVPLATLTFTFAARSGFPIYQTWFASRAQEVGGTLTDASQAGVCDPTGAALSLSSPAGEIATTTAAADGTYSFGDVAMRSDWTVTVTPPSGCFAPGGAEIAVDSTGAEGDDASRGDATLDVEAVVEVDVAGTVVDEVGDALTGIEVTVTRPDGSTASDVTDEVGAWAVPDNPVGEGYAVAVTIPEGYTAGPGGATREGLTLTEDGLESVTFVLVTDPDPEPTTPPTTPPQPSDPPPTAPPPSDAPPTSPPPGDAPPSATTPAPSSTASPTGTGHRSGGLASTGSDAVPLVASAGVGLLAGGLLVAVGRRRRHGSQVD